MSYYKTMMTGNNKKKVKKVIKEKSKPKKTVLDGIKQELNEWTHKPPTEKRWSKKTFDSGLTEHERQLKEVGAAAQYRPHIKKIDKYYDLYWKSVQDFGKVLEKKGMKKESKFMHQKYYKHVVEFKAWFTTFIKELL